METLRVQQDLSKLQLDEEESESEQKQCLDDVPATRLELLGIRTKPYSYVLDYFDGRSMSCCFLCNQQFEHYAFAVEHLRQAHFLVVDQLESVINVPLYLDLRRDHQTHSKGPFDERDDDFLRAKVRQSLLKELLILNENARGQHGTDQQCLFCKRMFGSDMSALFLHMFEEHGFNVGPLDNLVMADVFLEILRIQVNHLVCICCYKSFPDFSVLHQHLRKKKHFRIDPKFPLYDQFFLVNYLSRQDDDSSSATNADDCSVTSVDWTDLDQVEQEDTVCLFCEKLAPNQVEACQHMKSAHHFDYEHVCRTESLDEYQRVKLITYIRKQMKENRCLSCDQHFIKNLEQHMHEANHLRIESSLPFWQDDQYLIPLNGNDPLLWYEVEKY